MEANTRIELRDMLRNVLIERGIIILTKQRPQFQRRRLAKMDGAARCLFDKYVSSFTCADEAYYCVTSRDDPSLHICPVCGKQCPFNTKGKFYLKTCGSSDCRVALSLTESAKEKKRATCRLHYGVNNPFASPVIQEQCQHRMFEKYGVLNAMHSPVFVEKARMACIATYGAKYDEIKRKVCATNLERHGVEWPAQSPDIMAKMCKTCIANHGVKRPMQSDAIKRRFMDTMLARHGSQWAAQSPHLVAKICAANLKARGVEWPSQSPDVTRVRRYNKIANNTIADKNLAATYSNNEAFADLIRKMHNKRGLLELRDVAFTFGVGCGTIKKRADTLGLLQYFAIQDSPLELKFTAFLESHSIVYSRHNRAILHPQEIDVIVGSNGFEINDIHSHNITQKEPTYHQHKVLDALDRGIHLMHVWEWELVDELRWNALFPWLANLCATKRVIATGYHIDVLSPERARDFFERYELCCTYDKLYGLYVGDELVQIAAFAGDKLMQLCTKYGYEVRVNWLSKCVGCETILTHQDLTKLDSAYENIGFRIVAHSAPKIVSYDPDASCCHQVYDCGVGTFVLQKR